MVFWNGICRKDALNEYLIDETGSNLFSTSVLMYYGP
jgi:hypothetical protein